MNRFVRPDTDVLHLENGETLVVKRRLNTGERRRMLAAMYRDTPNGDGASRVDPQKVGIVFVLAYLVDWNLTDEGRPVVIRDQPEDVVRAALDQLEYDDFQEIKAAIDAHEARQETARAEEKKTRSGANGLSATSSSPSDVAGDTNGSASSTPTSTPSS